MARAEVSIYQTRRPPSESGEQAMDLNTTDASDTNHAEVRA